MARDASPFTPGYPVPRETFVGRKAELARLLRMTARVADGWLQVCFLSGERGIGKSSLAALVRMLAERDNDLIGIHAFFGRVNSLNEMVRRVFDRLAAEGADKPWHQRLRTFLGKHIEQVDLLGISVSFNATPEDLERLVNDFVPTMRRLVKHLGDKKGILLILDDINGLASSEPFANWLKSLVDEIATSPAPLPLFLLLVGLDERRRSLISLQPSLDRVLNPIELASWSNEETKDFFRSTFGKAGLTIDDDALEMLPPYVGGLPVLAHEVGDAIYYRDNDGRVNRADVMLGVYDAADTVGRKYFEPQVTSAIKSERYRTILRKITESGPRFERAAIRDQLNAGEAAVFDNFLRRMVELGVLLREADQRGTYQFPNLLHYLYLSLEAGRVSQPD